MLTCFLFGVGLVARYPTVSVTPDLRSGETILHFAVRQYHSVLLQALLSSKTLPFWLPMNSHGEDVLDVALLDKAVVQMILDHALHMKKDDMLSPSFSSLGNKLLINLMKLSQHYPEVVAHFLQRFGIDEVRQAEDLNVHEHTRTKLEKQLRYTYHHEEGLYFGPHNDTLEREGLVNGSMNSVPDAKFWPFQLLRFGKKYTFSSSISGGRLTLMPRVISIPMIAAGVPKESVKELHTSGKPVVARNSFSYSALHYFLKADSPMLFGRYSFTLVFLGKGHESHAF